MNQMNLSVFKGLGAAFYPEHHPKNTWRKHVDLMTEAGVSFVRIGEFAWDKMEPTEGVYDFGWLDEIFDILNKHKIKVILCTPTAVPPIWACEKYPEIFPDRQDNSKKYGFGGRRYTCPTSPAYHHLSENIVVQLGKKYGRLPQVTGWQIDNEIGHPFCFCPRCLNHFREWCREKFSTIENFNDSLETHFWGQTFQNFKQISFPVTYRHPSMWMTYHRFFSDMTVKCFGKQVGWLKNAGVKEPVTTNMMLTWYGYNHEDMAEHLDVISGDHYSGGNIFGKDFAGEAFVSAYLRGMKPDRNIWFNELQCSDSLPGQVRWWTLVQVGLGADQLDYFRWDTCPSGAERGGGLIKPCIMPGRVFNEIKQLGSDLEILRPLLNDTRPADAEVALLYSYGSQYDFAEYPKNEEFAGPFGNGYALHVAKHYRAIVANNIPADIVFPGSDFEKYKIIIAPACYVMTEKLASKIKEYIRNGGSFLLTPFSGVVDENAKMWNLPIPGPLSETFGIKIVDYGDYSKKAGELTSNSLNENYPFPKFKTNKWIDEIIPDASTEVLACFSGSFFNKLPALTRKSFGSGNAFYIGTWLEEKDYRIFYKVFLEANGIKRILELPEGIHVSCRKGKSSEIYFISNETNVQQNLVMDSRYRNLLSGNILEQDTVLSPFEVMVLGKV
jgi:beta-galactosidase